MDIHNEFKCVTAYLKDLFLDRYYFYAFVNNLCDDVKSFTKLFSR